MVLIKQKRRSIKTIGVNSGSANFSGSKIKYFLNLKAQMDKSLINFTLVAAEPNSIASNFPYKMLYVTSRTAEVTTFHILMLSREANG